MGSPETDTSPAERSRVRIGHVWVDAVTFGGALAAIGDLVRRGAGGAVFTPNVDHIVTAEQDAAFREAYEAADLSIADGKYVVWASRWLGTPIPEKVSGSDLIEPLLREAGRDGWRVFMLGGAPGVAEAAAEWSRRECGANVVGTASPFIRLDGSPGDLEQGVDEVVSCRPDLLLVAMGAPKQERWIHHNRARLGSAVALGIGASLDFVIGRVKRAPAWVSNAGLEWVYRLAREPRRLSRRYLVKDPRFLAVLARTACLPRDRRVIRGADGRAIGAVRPTGWTDKVDG
jgi:N-acetylglucosaminyldiphosphoundecaprenol N-acetyl-beta-D-mannosaminyltransferase